MPQEQNMQKDSNEQIDAILEGMIKETGLYQEGMDEDMKRVYKDKLRALLEERIGLALMHELQSKDPNLLVEFQEIAQKGDEKAINEFLTKNIEKREEIAAQTIKLFAAEYMNDAQNS